MKAPVWEYQISPQWKPRTPKEWQWFLVRKINYGNWKGLTKAQLAKWFPKIKNLIDPGKRAMLAYFLKK